jgi:hypothetical protein
MELVYWKLQGVGEIVYAGGERQKGYYENGIMTQTYEQYETSRIEQEKALQLQQDIDNANYFRKEYAEKIKEDMYALVYKSAIFGEELGKEKMVEFVEKIARDYLSRTPTEQDVKVIMEIIKETAAEIQFLAKLMKSADNGNTNGGIASSSFSEKDDLLQNYNPNHLYGSEQSNNNVNNINCPECNRMVDKPYHERGSKKLKTCVNPGYVLCSACYGLGYETTNRDCPYGGWCYERDCYVGICDDGWIKCDECRGTGKKK